MPLQTQIQQSMINFIVTGGYKLLSTLVFVDRIGIGSYEDELSALGIKVAFYGDLIEQGHIHRKTYTGAGFGQPR